ncbi:MAG TPA: class I SAM-dependent methyltransferase family protein [candidate division Zixibacteria bacterium]|nr:class I SAM-dependent methyltransferase family protein [candidate division Zixibacteria bacterium]
MPICLITRKEFGEEIRELVIRFDLLEDSFRIKSDQSHLIIPISRELLNTEFEQLRNIDSTLAVKNIDDLVKAKFHPHSHFDILKEKFSDEELALTPRSFDTIGDIVVIEIPDELWGKRIVIGEALLKVHSSVKTVYAKAGKVDGVNRIRPVEYLIGENKTKTLYKEHGIRLAVDITQAYFSPRLSEEHTRIAKQVNDNEVIIDLFCGIGPFVLPIAKKTNSIIHAIDINPKAIELLRENIALNKIKGKIIPYCGDCREIVEKEKLENIAHRTIMNLPGYAIEFVDVACKVIKSEGGIIHFFEFVGGENPEKEIVENITREIEKAGREVLKVLKVKKVRMSAPKQWQMVADVKII